MRECDAKPSLGTQKETDRSPQRSFRKSKPIVRSSGANRLLNDIHIYYNYDEYGVNGVGAGRRGKADRAHNLKMQGGTGERNRTHPCY